MNSYTYLFGALGVLFAAVVTGLVTWRVAKRNTSGTVETSEAASLWQEGASLRDSLTQQVVGLRGQLELARKQLVDATASIERLLLEMVHLQSTVDGAREETRNAREESALLRASIADVHEEVKTRNALTIGELADNAESRRIAVIPESDRTAGEVEHIDTLGIQTGSGPEPRGKP